MLSDHTAAVSASAMAGAMLIAARKLGLEGTFLRIAAAEMPDNSWLPTYAPSEDRDNVVIVTAAHRCVLDCSATSGNCLTALKIEEVVSKKMGRPYEIESVGVEGDLLRLRLHPFE